MGFAVRLSPDTPTQRFTLDIPAVAALVLNPTVNTVLVRVGGMDAPVSVDNASFFVPPGAALTYPVEGRTFCFTLGEPISLTANPGYPTSALIEMISVGEAMPQFASMALNAAFSAIVLAVQPDRPAGTYSDVYPLPKGVRSVTVRRFGGSVTDLYIKGVQTARWLLNAPGVQGYNTIPGSNISSEFTVLVDSELDSQIEITTVSAVGANNGYTLIGYQERLPHSVFRSDGRQMVDVMPPGVGALPISLALGTPSYVLDCIAGNPGAVQLIGEVTGIVAGLYRLDADINADDTALIGRTIILTHTDSANVRKAEIRAPVPVSRGVVWPSRTFVGGDKVRITSAGVAAAAGSTYSATVRLYRL